jgi:hypothetical protein
LRPCRRRNLTRNSGVAADSSSCHSVAVKYLGRFCHYKK